MTSLSRKRGRGRVQARLQNARNGACRRLLGFVAETCLEAFESVWATAPVGTSEKLEVMSRLPDFTPSNT